jgi:SAM-dependent methyltransferase
VSLPPEPKRTVLEDELVRRKQQREQSDSRYDEALTTLDGALWSPPPFPHPPPPPDETQVTPFNSRWEILRAKPSDGTGWRARLGRIVWTLVEPIFAEQQAFNSLVVDHLNRNIHPQREVAKSIASTISALQQQVEQICAFHSVLMQYLQRITPFVNSKDYEFDALGRRRHEDVQQVLYLSARTEQALTAAIQGLSDEFLKNIESLTSRVHRYDVRIEALAAATSVVQQHTAMLKRELARMSTSGTVPAAATSAPAPADRLATTSTLAGDSSLESWKYPAFEAAFRGSEQDVRTRLESYIPLFAGARDVLDVGCGRGEFLELLREAGITGRGLDLNLEMVEMCRARGLDVTHGDGLSYLRSLQDESLGGLFAAQVVEHLPPDYLLAFLNEAQRTLRPNGVIVLETINVACWYAFFQSYIRDITHARPLHPETLQYLVTASGFTSAKVQYRVPVPQAERLQRTPAIVREVTVEDKEDKEALLELADVVDKNVDTLNNLLFTYLDYAVIAKR